MSLILLPCSVIIQILFFLKKKLYQQSFKVPVVCFGNIYGGTGKTPLSIFVSKELFKKKRPYCKNIFNIVNII